MFAYLRKRGIASQVIRDFIQAGLLYEDAEHHNCVFVGRDGSGQPRFASKRGTFDLNGAGFKGDVAGSDKDVAFRLPCNPALNWVAVFEAPIDLMSFCTLHREVRSNVIALCGLHSGALDTYLREHPHLRHIILYAGRETLLKRLASRLEGRRSWGAQQIDRCIRAFDTDITEIKLATDSLTVGQAAERAAEIAGVPLIPDRRGPLRRSLHRLATQCRHIRLP